MAHENDEVITPPLPWASPAANGRRVAWGSGAKFDADSGPARRADAAPAGRVLNAGPAQPLDDHATDTARLHAGLLPQSDEQQTTLPAEADDVDLASMFDEPAAEEAPTAGEPGTEPVDLADNLFGDAPEASAENPAPEPSAAERGPVDDGASSEHTDLAPRGPEQVGPEQVVVGELANLPDDLPARDPAGALPGTALAVFGDEAPATEVAPPGTDSGDLNDLFGEEDPAAADSAPLPVPAVAAEAYDLEPTDGKSAEATGQELAVVEPAGSAAPARRKGSFDLAAHRAATEAAQQLRREDIAAEVSSESLRYAAAEQFAPIVDRILGLGASGDPHVQSFIKRLVLTRDPGLDRRQRWEYEETLAKVMATQGIHLENPRDRETIFDIAYDELLGIGPLGPLWRDDTISEILVSGADKVTIERDGRLIDTPVRFRDLQHLERTARTLAGLSSDDRGLSASSPVPTIHLDGARIQFVWHPLAVNGVAIAIRKFGRLFDFGQLLEFGAVNEEMATFLRDVVVSRGTVLVSGGTGTGKTTWVNALSEFIPDTERVVTIEDARELRLRNRHVEPLVTKESASADDLLAWDQAVLLKTSLRLRPDRIIVGEIRESSGCSVMLEAANTGHDGTMTTIHATSAKRALTRLSMLLRKGQPMPVDVARAEVGAAIDIVVHVAKVRGVRFLSEVLLVEEADEGDGGYRTTLLFTGELAGGGARPVFRQVGSLGPDTELATKMLDAGLDASRWE